ncbi:MAG: LamG domain-containing protein, partial [Candidatus Paceibacterota bacterium]
PGGSYGLASLLESEKYTQSRSKNDGGFDPERFEIGSDLSLWDDIYGLVGCWDFDEGSGITAYDSSGKGNDGTLINNPSWQSSGSCKDGSCLSFDGIDDYVDIYSGDILPRDTDFSLFFWGQMSAVPDGTNTQFLSSNGFLYFYSNANYGSAINQIRFYDDSLGEVVVGSDIRGKGWIHIGLIRNSDDFYLYEDGLLVDSNTVSRSIMSYNELSIGGKHQNRYHNGQIDDMRIYNRALSVSEIQLIFNAGK